MNHIVLLTLLKQMSPGKEGWMCLRRGARAGSVHKVVVKELKVSSRITLGLPQDHRHHLPLHRHKHNLGVLRTFLEKILSALKLNII